MPNEIIKVDATPLARSVQREEWPMIEAMGSVLARSGLCTNTRTVEQAIVKIWFGREMGISAALAVQDIHFIEGKPSFGVNVMQAKLAGGGVKWSEKETAGSCEITFTRPGWEPKRVAFTEADARAAGLLSKKNWQSYKRQMLYARCFSMGAKRIGSDLLNGACYTPDELGAETNEDGEPTAAPIQAAPVQPQHIDADPTINAPPQKRLITEPQRKRLFAVSKQGGWDAESIKAYLHFEYNIDSSKEITTDIYDEICEKIGKPPNGSSAAIPSALAEPPPWDDADAAVMASQAGA